MSQPIRRRHLLGASAAVLSVAFLPGCSSLPVIPKRPAPDIRAGLGFVGVQGEVRFRLAGSLLLQQAMPVSEVGFVCGYADQAHLTREFKKRLGVTPAKYRELFAPA